PEVVELEAAALDRRQRAALPGARRIADLRALRRGLAAAAREEAVQLHRLRRAERVARDVPVVREERREPDEEGERAGEPRLRDAAPGVGATEAPPAIREHQRAGEEIEERVRPDRDGVAERDAGGRDAECAEARRARRQEEEEAEEAGRVGRQVT